MNLNWVDWVIIAVGAFYIFQGWEYGLIKLATSLVAFLGSLWLSIKCHTLVGNFLTMKFGVPNLWATLVGYLTVAIISETVIKEVLSWIGGSLPFNFAHSNINKLLGAVLSVGNAAVIMAFVFVVVLALPIKGTVKADIGDSYLGSRLVQLAEKYGGTLQTSLTQATSQAQKFLTVEPQSNESIELSLNQANLVLTVDTDAEVQMMSLVNAERAKVGVAPLKLDAKIRAVARAHSEDMYKRSYFSHIDPDGHDAGYRLDQAGITYTIAGENLAYAPDLQTAHTGLMNSPGHRKNILEPRCTRVGIGVVNGGLGNEMMFTQDFAD